MPTTLASGLLDLIYYHVVMSAPDDAVALHQIAQLIDDLTDAGELITLYGLDAFTSSQAESAGEQLAMDLA